MDDSQASDPVADFIARRIARRAQTPDGPFSGHSNVGPSGPAENPAHGKAIERALQPRITHRMGAKQP